MEEPNDFISIETCNNENESQQYLNTHHIYIVDNETIGTIRPSPLLIDTTEHKKKYTTSLENIKTQNNIEIYNITHQPNKVSTIRKLFNSSNSKYKVSVNNKLIIDRIEYLIFLLCNIKNIVIYILLPNTSSGFINNFNNLLYKLPFKYYSNIIIINFINYSTETSVMSYTSTELSQINLDQTCVYNIYSKNHFKKFFKVINVGCNIYEQITKYGIYMNIRSKLRKGFSFINNTELYNQQFLDDLIKKYNCSQGRLIQFTGTCWLNAILNSILLPKNMRNLMKLQTKKYIDLIKSESPSNMDAIDIDDIIIETPNGDDKQDKNILLMSIYDLISYKEELSIKQMFIIIIYNIFILNVHPKLIDFTSISHTQSTNFILVLAYKFINDGSMSISQDIQCGNLTGCEDTIHKVYEFIINEYLINFRDYFISIPIFINYHSFTTYYDPIKNLIKFQKKMKNGDKIYNLISCIIFVDYIDSNLLGHVICGYMCDDIQYIFDSNHNVLIQSDWINHDFQNYVDYIERVESLKIQKIGIVSINYLLDEFLDSQLVQQLPLSPQIELPINTCYEKLKRTFTIRKGGSKKDKSLKLSKKLYTKQKRSNTNKSK